MLKPNIGVTKVQVTIPVAELNSTVFIAAPLLVRNAVPWAFKTKDEN